jgi:acyl-CoA thioester hydrolase
MNVFTYPVQVRWSDIDSYDHVNNVRYFDYLQEARIAFLAHVVGTAAGDFFSEFPCVLVNQAVDYLRPILLRRPPYDVAVWVSSVGDSSYTLGSRIVGSDGDEDPSLVYARATSVMVAVDALTHTKRALSQTERQALTKHISVT